jgi:hypothetical protein
MSDSEYSSSSSSEEERATPIKVTKAKKTKINETVAKIIDKEKTKRTAKSKEVREKSKKVDLKNPVEPEEPKVDPRDAELMDIKQALAELKTKFTTTTAPPAPAPAPAPKQRKPKALKEPKAEKVEKKVDSKAQVAPAAPPPLKLTRDELLRQILFS